ncbi:MAG: GNAT family N-acetyltransferase [bacterium]
MDQALTAASLDIVVRDARVHEHDVISALTVNAYAEYATIMTPLAWAPLERAVVAALASSEMMQRIVADRDGEIVGSVFLFPAASDVYGDVADRSHCPVLRLLAVTPDARRLGVGKLLVDECVRRARLLGASELGLHTSVSMQGAVRLYQRMGFVRAPEFDFQPEGAELVEAYRLRL